MRPKTTHPLIVEVQPLPTLRLWMQPSRVTMLETWPNGVPKAVSSVPTERFISELTAARHAHTPPTKGANDE